MLGWNYAWDTVTFHSLMVLISRTSIKTLLQRGQEIQRPSTDPSILQGEMY